MGAQSRVPDEPLGFIKHCIERKRTFWTYHVNMRLGERPISRAIILGVVGSFEIIEQYPDDKYFPSYLITAAYGDLVFHVQIATDVASDNIRIVTAYKPDPVKWDSEFRTRREKT